MPLRAVAVTFTACALCAGAAAAPRSSTQKLDVELAVDTTGSMGPSIRRIQRDAEKLVGGIEARVPGARVAVVQFKDAGDTPEYELVQPLTLSAKAAAAAVGRLSAGGGGDNPEAYNVVFRNSYADRAVGWRSGARKVVVVNPSAARPASPPRRLPPRSLPGARPGRSRVSLTGHRRTSSR
jgi:hypothetical protein